MDEKPFPQPLVHCVLNSRLRIAVSLVRGKLGLIFNRGRDYAMS